MSDIQGGGLLGGWLGSLAGMAIRRVAGRVAGGPARSPGTHGAGGSSMARAGTGVRAVGGEARHACSSGTDVMSCSGLTCAAHPAQYRGDPPSGFPQFGQTRMGAPWPVKRLRPTSWAILIGVAAAPERQAACC